MAFREARSSVAASYRRSIQLPGLEAPVWAALAYWPMVLFARGVPWLGLLTGNDGHIEVDGVHIHHMNFGLALALGGGLLLLQRRFRRLAGLAFGAGAALILDEYSLILYVEDVYWEWRGVVVSLIALGSGGLAFGVFALFARDVAVVTLRSLGAGVMQLLRAQR